MSRRVGIDDPVAVNEREVFVSLERWNDPRTKEVFFVLLVRKDTFHRSIEISQDAAERLSETLNTPIDNCITRDKPF